MLKIIVVNNSHLPVYHVHSLEAVAVGAQMSTDDQSSTEKLEVFDHLCDIH